MSEKLRLVRGLVAFLASTTGRDKACRTVQYGGRYLSALLRLYSKTFGPALELAEKVDKISSQMGMTRKVLRIGRPIGIALNLAQKLNDKTQPCGSKMFRVLSDLCLTLYFLLDHVLWLQRIGVLKGSLRQQKLTDWWSELAWFGEIVCSLCAILLELQDERRLASQAAGSDAKQSTARPICSQSRLSSLRLDLLRYLLDAPVCLFFMDAVPISSGTAGLLGFVSSLIGAYQSWPTV
eukprot:GILK01007639.1.p1 GENE.GILK01007639.1~~GILK01007639.1.p1  ORF type:complete len:249 (-),score=19.43 GILK01007639.1:177-887(-)